jgi:hypothetical protein
LSVTAASAFITRLIDVILERSEESWIISVYVRAEIDRDVGKPGLMLRISLQRFAQHDSAIIGRLSPSAYFCAATVLF